jgi:hypothetical protein
MTSASKGTERELFVEVFLKNVLPPGYRFGTGDITDVNGHRTGQIDVVIEHASIPSFPLVGATIPRLYLAEGVAVAIEVKSDLTKQWDEALSTAKSVAALCPKHGHRVPLVVIGYKGWKSAETLLRHAQEANDVGAGLSAVISIDPAHYVGTLAVPKSVPRPPIPGFPNVKQPPLIQLEPTTFRGQDEFALFCLLMHIHASTTPLLA